MADTGAPMDAQTDEDSSAWDRAARRQAEVLTRIAREATHIAQDGQALAEVAARAATEGRIAAEVAREIAERAQRLAEARQRVAEAARAAAEEAERVTTESLRLRSETLAAVAHDLRMPLTSLVGRADLTRKRLDRAPDLNPERAWLAAQLDEVQAAAMRLRGAIDELDDAAQLAAGQDLNLAREPVDVGALARAVAQEFALQRAVAVVAPDTPVLVAGDRGRLDRALQNLVGNAVKYSPPEAPITVTVERGASAAVIAVRDRGVGIPAAEAPRIFERYYRAATARGIAGSGLGLAGVKAIVERHGGAITVESAEGRGTTVTLTVPLAPPAHAALPAHAAPPAHAAQCATTA